MEEEIKQETQIGEIKEEVKEETEEINPIEEAKLIRDETKRNLIAITEERKKIEKATAELLVGGRSFAGQQTKQETVDEKWAREAKERYAGTGMDPT